MFKILIPAVAALGLVAFTAKTQPAISDVAAAPSSDAMAWHLSQEGDMAKLAYGMANSDQLAMMVTCAPGDATAAIYGDVRPVTATAEPSSEMQESRVSIQDVALRGLAERGALSVVGDQGAFIIRASGPERRGIGQFLDYCSRKSA